MVLLVEKIVSKTEDNSIYRCVMLIAYLPTSGIQKPWTIYQNSLDFNKFLLTKVLNLVYVIFLNIKMQKWRVRTSSLDKC